MATIRSNGFTEYPKNPANSVGKQLLEIPFQTTITSGGSAIGEVYILAGPFSFASKISKIVGATPAMTSATDNDLGFFKQKEDGTFEALDADILWDGVSLASALSYRELLGTLNAALDRDDNVGTLLGLGVDSEPVGGVFLGLTTNVASTAASVDLKLAISIEQATTE